MANMSSLNLMGQRADDVSQQIIAIATWGEVTGTDTPNVLLIFTVGNYPIFTHVGFCEDCWAHLSLKD